MRGFRSRLPYMETTTERDNLRYTKIPLTDGSGMIPALGFGTLIPDPIDTKNATRVALEAGFRQFDSSARYRNEKEVSEAIQEVFKEGKIKREDVFIATKLWNNNHRPERVKPAFEASLKRLQLDYVDLYLIHTPFAFQPGDEQDPRDQNGKVIYDDGVTLLDTWGALQSLVDEGSCKAIGLSDVNVEETKGIFESARIKPALVHVESHPYLPEWELLEFCNKNGIVLQAFAALGHSTEPKLLDDPVIISIAKRVNMNLPRFDGHGNSKKERGPDGSKKERATGLYGAIQKPSSGDGGHQGQEFGADCARAWV